jgi:uncharacterized protein YodC (DUF2158 family)
MTDSIQNPFRYRIGDLVQLKSLGPPMTVLSSSVDEVWVNWMTADCVLHSAPFNPCMLIPYLDKANEMTGAQ